LSSSPDLIEERYGEHVLPCDVSLKKLAIPRVSAKMLSCKLLSTADAFVLYSTFFYVNF
jgi:hypothetical protein